MNNNTAEPHCLAFRAEENDVFSADEDSNDSEGKDNFQELDEEGDVEKDEERHLNEEASSVVRPPPIYDRSKRKRRRRDKMFQDCLAVHIPIEITADLGVAILRTRRKRIGAFKQAFPDLFAEETHEATELSPKIKSVDLTKGDATMEEPETSQKQASSNDNLKFSTEGNMSHVPKREDFSNVVDYLEAKYVQGVMIEEEQIGADLDDGQGSVYSQSSFLDDRDLQRDVAEQVLAQSTTTKLELESNGDDAFFVNVGNLEVEESFLTEEGYDPVNDQENVQKSKKKRKQPSEQQKTGSVDNGRDRKNQTASKSKSPSTAKSKAESSTISPKRKSKITGKPAMTKKKDRSPVTPAEKAASEKKKQVDEAYRNVVDFIKDMSHEDLPRRKTKEKVAITCPQGRSIIIITFSATRYPHFSNFVVTSADKKPGDSILFANPHVPGQRLKVKIPKKTAPGGTFRVSVPVAQNPDDDDSTDHNKWSRDFYDCFGEYCRLYDEWIDLVATVKEEKGVTDFVVYTEKRNRFDQLVKDIPQDLKTPLDKSYMQKLLRRARQNRHKRERTLKRQEERAKELRTDQSDDNGDGGNGEVSDQKKIEEEKEPAGENEDVSTRTVLVPALSTEFQGITFNPNYF